MKSDKQTQNIFSINDIKIVTNSKNQKLLNCFFGLNPRLFSFTTIISIFICQFVFATIYTPPTGKIRGMYVSCGEQLIIEIKNNTNSFDSINDSTHASVTPNTWGLLNYCQNHYITYISVYGLGQKYNSSTNDPIVGNMLYFDATKKFLEVMHSHNIQVGIVISNKGFLDESSIDSNFITSPFYWESPILPWDTTCSNQRLSSGSLISNFGIPENNQLNPTCYGKPEDCYPTFEKSEMLKQIMRVLQYSIWVRDSTDHQSYKNSVTNNTIPPDSSIYLFDYMSLEYEYWDSTTFSKTAPSAGMSYRKAAWNNLYQYSGLMLYVYGQMCNFMNMELELRIVPPITNVFSANYPTGPGDTAAFEMPVVSMQVEYLARAFNRILVSNYKDRVNGTNIISKTGATHTKFSAHLNDLNPDERHKIMPVFSAATKDDYKHCFGDTLRSPSSPYAPLQWSEDYFGPILTGSDTSRNFMNFFEQLYLDVLDSAIASTAPTYLAPNCNEYKNAPGLTTCLIDTTNEDIVGFMWYNYSMLSDSSRTPVNFNRQKGKVLAENQNFIQFNSSNYTIQTIVSEEIIGKSEVQILNMQGALIISYTINSSTQSFTLTSLPSGIYLCRINQGKSEPLKISIIK